MLENVTLREATPDDLPWIYRLAQRALTLDRFSEALLREKLFVNRQPEQFTFDVVVAEHSGEIIGFMQHVARPSAGKGWLGLFAVATPFRRQGIAQAMWERVTAKWPAEVTEIEALAIPGNYFIPGLDPRYTSGLCFLERTGFERFRDCANLIAQLEQPFEVADEEARAAEAGITVRRARRADDPLLDHFFADQFGADWRLEASLAFEVDPPALHLALKGEQIIAFSAHSTQNREWGFFGPMGTTEAARGKGLGRLLLWRCLNDLRDLGHTTAIIPWVGPIAFYHQWAQCVVDRVFWRYRRSR